MEDVGRGARRNARRLMPGAHQRPPQSDRPLPARHGKHAQSIDGDWNMGATHIQIDARWLQYRGQSSAHSIIYSRQPTAGLIGVRPRLSPIRVRPDRLLNVSGRSIHLAEPLASFGFDGSLLHLCCSTHIRMTEKVSRYGSR